MLQIDVVLGDFQERLLLYELCVANAQFDLNICLFHGVFYGVFVLYMLAVKDEAGWEFIFELVVELAKLALELGDERLVVAEGTV